MQRRLIDRPFTGVWIVLGLLMLTATMMSCSWPGSYLRHDWNIENQFDSHEIFSEHQYFIGGTLEDPRGIVVLRPEYKLDSPNWQPVDMTAGALAQWIEALKKDYFVSYNTFANGAKIIGDDGEVAGYYYSVWEFPLVRMPEKNTIALAVPRAEYRSTNRRIEFFVDDNRADH